MASAFWAHLVDSTSPSKILSSSGSLPYFHLLPEPFQLLALYHNRPRWTWLYSKKVCTSILSVTRKILQDWSRWSKYIKFYLFPKFARAYETWKQCRWIMWTLTCKQKIWGENCLYLRPHLKAFPVFNVLETCRVYLLTIDLGIFKFIKKFVERFFWKMRNL